MNKANYDYRIDVFPAQELENGTYLIMHNGKYLTNQNENVAGSVPQFIDKRDDVKDMMAKITKMIKT